MLLKLPNWWLNTLTQPDPKWRLFPLCSSQMHVQLLYLFPYFQKVIAENAASVSFIELKKFYCSFGNTQLDQELFEYSLNLKLINTDTGQVINPFQSVALGYDQGNVSAQITFNQNEAKFIFCGVHAHLYEAIASDCENADITLLDVEVLTQASSKLIELYFKFEQLLQNKDFMGNPIFNIPLARLLDSKHSIADLNQLFQILLSQKVAQPLPMHYALGDCGPSTEFVFKLTASAINQRFLTNSSAVDSPIAETKTPAKPSTTLPPKELQRESDSQLLNRHRLVEIAKDELAHMKKYMPSNYRDLKQKFYRSLNQEQAELLLDLKNRMDAHLFNSTLDPHIIDFMIHNPNQWSSSNRSILTELTH